MLINGIKSEVYYSKRLSCSTTGHCVIVIITRKFEASELFSIR